MLRETGLSFGKSILSDLAKEGKRNHIVFHDSLCSVVESVKVVNLCLCLALRWMLLFLSLVLMHAQQSFTS